MKIVAQAAPAEDAPIRGIVYLSLGVSVFVLQDVIVKTLSGAYPVHEMLLIRSLAGLPLVLGIAAWQGKLASLRPHPVAVARGVIHFLSFTCYYLALAALPLAETATLYYSGPLFITALSVPFLGEVVGLRRWAAVIAGFAGVMVVMRPGVHAVEPAMLLAVGAALLYAVSMLITRKAGARITAIGFALHSMVTLSLCSAASGLVLGDGRLLAGEDPAAAFLLRAWAMPAGWDLLLLLLMGPISAAGFLLIAQAYRTAPASLVTPFEYASLPAAVAAGYIFWGDLPADTTWIGLALIVGAGLYILHRERVNKRALTTGWPPMRPRL